jgi:hypothetical protein
MDVEPDIPWELIAGFVRQFTHEVRNGLNSLDLEAALMQELAADDEAHACAARARQQGPKAGGTTTFALDPVSKAAACTRRTFKRANYC